jgi:demethylmenaquinone methyltransferase/2-methoxy-6-polyprenyl-1,4-benzoquinol methylase
MILPKQEVKAKYQLSAKYYDFAVQLGCRLIGLNIEAYRSRAVELLHLKRGDRVVELGCGTGLNFRRIIEQIGPEGRIIGVDISSNMLASARERVERFGWKNIELVQSDIAAYDFPKEVNRILSVGVFGYVAEYDHVIEAASHALVPGGRIVIVDGKRPERWPLWLLKLFVGLWRPFGLTLDYFNRHTWESVERYFQETAFEDMYGGLLYISSGTAA